jgi:lysozyme
MRYLLSVLILALFVTAFYYFFIRPYAYRWRSCDGLTGYGICMPHRYTVHGIDISHHQGNINWDTLEISRVGLFPIRFIFMKATEGSDWTDRNFENNFADARLHGFMRGAYHYFKPAADARMQADNFIRHVDLRPGDLPPVLDVEEKGLISKTDLQRGVKSWLLRIEEHYGVKPILYASYRFRTRYLNDPFFDDYPYWIAHYYVESVRYAGSWLFWQHTDRGQVPGIPEPVDLNIFNGKFEDLQTLTLR